MFVGGERGSISAQRLKPPFVSSERQAWNRQGSTIICRGDGGRWHDHAGIVAAKPRVIIQGFSMNSTATWGVLCGPREAPQPCFKQTALRLLQPPLRVDLPGHFLPKQVNCTSWDSESWRGPQPLC